MATIPTRTRLKNVYHSRSDLVTYSIMTSSLVDCARYLAMTGEASAQPYITDLLILAAERTQALHEMLEQAEVRL